MALANIMARSFVRYGSFNIPITFEEPVEDFNKDDITITAATGNGVTNLDYKVLGSGKNYSVPILLPRDVSGSFSIEITGMVIPVGESIEESVTATSKTIEYDTTSTVYAVFGTPSSVDGTKILLPVTFYADDTSIVSDNLQNVLWYSRTDTNLIRLSGDEIFDMEYYLLGSGSSYTLVFIPQIDKKGSFEVDIHGDIIKQSTSVIEGISEIPKLIYYNTIVPIITRADIPQLSEGDYYDIEIDFNVPVTGLSVNSFLIIGPSTLPDPDLYRDNTHDDDIDDEYETDIRPTTEVTASDWTEESSKTIIRSRFFTLRFDLPEDISGIVRLSINENEVINTSIEY